MIRAFAAVLFVGLSSAVCAQEQLPPRERALMERINTEINGGLVCATNSIALQDRVRQLEKDLVEAKKSKDKK